MFNATTLIKKLTYLRIRLPWEAAGQPENSFLLIGFISFLIKLITSRYW